LGSTSATRSSPKNKGYLRTHPSTHCLNTNPPNSLTPLTSPAIVAGWKLQLLQVSRIFSGLQDTQIHPKSPKTHQISICYVSETMKKLPSLAIMCIYVVYLSSYKLLLIKLPIGYWHYSLLFRCFKLLTPGAGMSCGAPHRMRNLSFQVGSIE